MAKTQEEDLVWRLRRQASETQDQAHALVGGDSEAASALAFLGGSTARGAGQRARVARGLGDKVGDLLDA